MKALLITRCGCSKLVDVPSNANEFIFEPLKPLEGQPLDYHSTVPIDEPENREFRLNGKTHVRGLGIILKYEEI